MTDQELIESLATQGMGWQIFQASGHRRGSRPLPHAWRWPRNGSVKLMVWDGKANREWNPIASRADQLELRQKLLTHGVTLTFDTVELPPLEGFEQLALAADQRSALERALNELVSLTPNPS